VGATLDNLINATSEHNKNFIRTERAYIFYSSTTPKYSIMFFEIYSEIFTPIRSDIITKTNPNAVYIIHSIPENLNKSVKRDIIVYISGSPMNTTVEK